MSQVIFMLNSIFLSGPQHYTLESAKVAEACWLGWDMVTDSDLEKGECTLQLAQPLQVLDAGLVVLIDRYLAGIGGYGELRLKVAEGRVRFVEVAVSVDVQKVTQTI